MIVQLPLTQSISKTPFKELKASVLKRKIEGIDQFLIVTFFMYLSVTVNSCWHPMNCL